MSASPREILRDAARLGDSVVRPLPGSRKIHVPGSRPDLKVAMREVAQADTPSKDGPVANPPLTLYDTSGPYTDPDYGVDLLKGLPALRRAWIEERGDTEVLAAARRRAGGRHRVSGDAPGAPRGPGSHGDPDALRPPGHRDAGDGVRRHP